MLEKLVTIRQMMIWTGIIFFFPDKRQMIRQSDGKVAGVFIRMVEYFLLNDKEI